MKLNAKISSTLDQIAINPEMYPSTIVQQNVRRCVLNKQTTIYYRTSKEAIQILTLFDTRQDPDDLKF